MRVCHGYYSVKNQLFEIRRVFSWLVGDSKIILFLTAREKKDLFWEKIFLLVNGVLLSLFLYFSRTKLVKSERHVYDR